MVVDATCTSDGYTEHICERCGHNHRDDFTPALGHNYEDRVVAATCETAGYTEHTCKRCDHSYMDSLVQPLGHDYQAVVTAPTHDKMGYTTYTCAREGCGHSYVSDYTDALGHTYTQTVTKEATCTEEGVMTFTCDCGKSATPSPSPRRSIRMIPSSRSLTAPTWAIPPTPAPSAAAAIRTPL